MKGLSESLKVPSMSNNKHKIFWIFHNQAYKKPAECLTDRFSCRDLVSQGFSFFTELKRNCTCIKLKQRSLFSMAISCESVTLTVVFGSRSRPKWDWSKASESFFRQEYGNSVTYFVICFVATPTTIYAVNIFASDIKFKLEQLTMSACNINKTIDKKSLVLRLTVPEIC